MVRVFLLFSFMFVFSHGSVFAGTPIVVEMFGKNGCTEDTNVQEALSDLLKEYEGAIFINCRQWTQDDGSVPVDNTFSHKFCGERSKAYADRLSVWGGGRSAVVVNGRWDAYTSNLSPALKVGVLDGVLPVGLRLDEGGRALDIDLPKAGADGAQVQAEIYLYAYAPTQGNERIFADADVEITDELRARVQNGESVPFVTRRHTEQFLFRPVIARERVGAWDGKAIQMSYTLDDVKAMAGSLSSDLSYVVMVHQGDEYGPILAVGEVMAQKERDRFSGKIPSVVIERISNPPESTGLSQ